MTAPDAARGDAPQTWRVRVDEPDEVTAEDAAKHERCFADVTVESYAPGLWCARGPEELTESCGEGATPREAVLRWVQEIAPWVAVEILAPGELSRRELIAERDAAIARAVAEEREACAAVCDEYAASLDADSPDDLEEIDDEHEESYGQFTGALHLAAAIRARGGAR